MKNSMISQALSSLRGYKDDHVSCREEIKKQRRNIKEIANRVTHDYGGVIVDHDVSNEWIKISEGISAIQCVLNSDECTVLNMVISNGEIRKHKHTRQEEIFVVSGEIEDHHNNVVTKQGGVYIIPPNSPHAIRAKYAKITVVYRPPFPKVKLNAKRS